MTKATSKEKKDNSITQKKKSVSPKQRRIIFDKKKVCYKKRKGKSSWDYSITNTKIKAFNKVNHRNLDFRVIEMIVGDNTTKTFADILKLRIDWIVPDSQGIWGTDESINQSIAVCKMNLELIEDKLEELGFNRVGLKEKLQEEDRRTINEVSLTDRLEDLGLTRSNDNQLTLFPEE